MHNFGVGELLGDFSVYNDDGFKSKFPVKCVLFFI